MRIFPITTFIISVVNSFNKHLFLTYFVARMEFGIVSFNVNVIFLFKVPIIYNISIKIFLQIQQDGTIFLDCDTMSNFLSEYNVYS